MSDPINHKVLGAIRRVRLGCNQGAEISSSLIGYIYIHTSARAILPCMLSESVVVKLLLVVLVELVMKVLDNRVSFFST